jgi:hypothetical protein
MIEVWDRATCWSMPLVMLQDQPDLPQLKSWALWRSIVAVQQRLAPYKPLELIGPKSR